MFGNLSLMELLVIFAVVLLVFAACLLWPDNLLPPFFPRPPAGDIHPPMVAALIVWAIAEGRRAAHHIDKYLMGESILPESEL